MTEKAITLDQNFIFSTKWTSLGVIQGISDATRWFLEGCEEDQNFISDWQLVGDEDCENRVYTNDLKNYLDYAEEAKGKLKKELTALCKFLDENQIDYFLNNE